MYTATAPIPPPKSGSHDASRRSTPATSQSPRPPPPIPSGAAAAAASASSLPEVAASQSVVPEAISDPGDHWLPKALQDKSKQDLAEILASPELLDALTHGSDTAHPSLSASHAALAAALDDNMQLAVHLQELEARLAQQRAATQAQLLGAHALERSWRSKQADMDAALAPFAPASLYQRLAAGVAEQEQVCQALEESFLMRDGRHSGPSSSRSANTAGGGPSNDNSADNSANSGNGMGDETNAAARVHVAAAVTSSTSYSSEREVADWIRRYREARKLYYLRQERRERWDEGRVGGWR